MVAQICNPSTMGVETEELHIGGLPGLPNRFCLKNKKDRTKPYYAVIKRIEKAEVLILFSPHSASF